MVDYIWSEYSETRGKELASKQRMIIFLCFSGDPSYQNGVVEEICVSRSIVTIPRLFLERVIEKPKEWFMFHTGRKI